MTEHPLAITEEPRGQALRFKVQTWMMEEGWSIREEDTADLQWVLVGQDAMNRSIVVAQKVNRPDQILINGKVTLGPEHVRGISELDESELYNFRFGLTTALLGIGVEFVYQGDPMTDVMIAERIYEDALTKDEFLQRVSRVKSGVTMTLIHIQHRFQQVPPDQDEMGFRTD